MRQKILAVFLLIGSGLSGAEVIPSTSFPSPWLTGSLLAPPGQVTPRGSVALQPYLFSTVNYAEFDSHWHTHSIPRFTSITSQLFIWVGLTSWMDFFIFPGVTANFSQGKSSAGFADLPLGFDFQLLSPDATWFPGIKLIIAETFPIGKYQNLSPDKKGTDAIGAGLYSTNIGLVFYKLFHLEGIHYLSSNFSVQYSFSPLVNLKNFNAYGGGFGTEGSLRAGKSLTLIYSLELSLSQHWVFALDNVYVHTDRNRFSGREGFDLEGMPTVIEEVSSEQFSLCPAIEYNFSKSLGLIGGAWIAVVGRNSFQFASAVASLTYTY